MGRFTRYTAQPDQSYDPRVTDLRSPFNVPAATGPQAVQPGDVVTGVDAMGNPQFKRAAQWVNRNIANTFPLTVIGSSAASVRLLPANPKRTGVLIQNKDAASTINYSFGNAADVNSLQLGPGAAVLLDFTTPATELYFFNANAANVIVAVMEMARV